MRALILIVALGCGSNAVAPVSSGRAPPTAAGPGGLQRVVLERTSYQLAEPILVRLTGRVVLDGGCSSGRPELGLEQQVGSAWEVRIPMPTIQMTCGAPEVDWVGQRVGITLPHQPGLAPGTYRLVFSGGDRKLMRTAPFEMK
jgi:hypothetical protein